MSRRTQIEDFKGSFPFVNEEREEKARFELPNYAYVNSEGELRTNFQVTFIHA